MSSVIIFQGKIFRILLLVSMCLFSSAQVFSQSWFNSNWSYRLPVTIINNGEQLTDYQVNVSLDGTFNWNHSNSDGSDIRFTTSDGITPLSYWIENWDSENSASLWVKVPEIASGNTTLIYLYYGNSSVASASNGFSTFEFFDDFEEGAINSSRWLASGGSWSAVSAMQQNGSTSYVAQGTVTTGNQILQGLVFSGTDYIAEVYGRQISGNNWGLCTRVTAANSYYLTALYDNHDTEANLFTYEWNPLTHPFWSTALGTISPNVWYKMSVKVFGSNIHVFIDDIQWQTIEDSNHTSGGVALWLQATETAQYNDLRVRKYATEDPVCVAGTEENQYPPLTISYTKSDVTCYGGADGSIDITVTDGSGNYTYVWTPGGQTTQDISGLPAGTYSVHVEDGLGSIGDRVIEITQPGAISLGYSIITPFDCTAGFAAVQITASGGTEPYSGTGNFQQLAGTTVYEVTDANGCTANLPVTVGPGPAWYDVAWTYRDPVDISNADGSVLSDFQIKVELDDTFDFTRINVDGSDIRFTADDGSTLLPYWIESWDNANNSATIWVKIPEINTPGTTVYMYYGNSGAISASDGAATFKFFDDFESDSPSVGAWSGSTAHDWKYSMHMQEGALYYSIMRAQNGWTTESLDAEIENEFIYIHNQINANGTVSGLSSEPVYCYGLVLSTLSLGYDYFRVSNPTLAQRCYHDMGLVYGYMASQWSTPSTAPDYSISLIGFANACKAFEVYGATDTVAVLSGIIENYVAAFTQSSGGWTGQSGVQDHLKRDFGVLLAYDVIGDDSYLTRVRDNIDWILVNRWVASNGGVTWTSPTPGEFYECHQQWFMIAVKMLYDRNTTYDYLEEGLAAWRFLTDNNYANIDWYVHNYEHQNAFFSYRQMLTDGSFQTATFKGSYEIGTALWGMSLNYDWVSNYQSSHSSQAYNYLDEMAKQTKKAPEIAGFFSSANNWIRSLSWSASAWQPDTERWIRVGSPSAQLVDDGGNNVLSLRGTSHNDFYATVNQTFEDFIFEAEVNLTQDVNNSCNPEIGFHYSALTNRYFTMMRGETVNDLFLRRIEGGISYVDDSSPYNFSAGIYYNYKITFRDNVIKLYLDDELVTDYTDNGNILTGGFSLGNYAGTPVYYDDVRVREYAAVEPVVSVGTGQFLAGNWTGASSTDWNDPLNWINGLPGPCSLVAIASTATNQPRITSSAECFNLTIENSSELTIEETGALTINGEMANDGSFIIESSLASSGSLILKGSGTGHITYNRLLKPGSSQNSDWHLAAPPVTANSNANTGKITTVYQWSEPTGTWATTAITSAVAGRGYNIRQEPGSDGVISFTGPLANGDVTFDASSPFAEAAGAEVSYFDRTYVIGRSPENPGGRGWNLLGNPYPSAISAEAFILANFNSAPGQSQFDPNHAALYLFDGTTRGYYYIARSTGWPSGSYLDEAHIQAGQGFFVMAMDDDSQFTFSKSMQAHSTATPMLKSGGTDERWPGLQLKAKHASGEVVTTVVYGGEMTTGVDPGYDIGLFKSGQGMELYTLLAMKDNGINYTRQALPVAGADTLAIPVGVDFKSGGEVTFSAVTVPVDGRRFWLSDKLAGTFTELGLKSYTVTLPADTYGTGRFFIIASANTPTDVRHPEATEGDLRIWVSGGLVIIDGIVSEGSLCEIFDIQGRKLLERKLSDGDMNVIEMPVGMHGVLAVKVTDGVRVVSRKVVVP